MAMRQGVLLTERARVHDDFILLGDECKCRPAKGLGGGAPIVVQNEITASLQVDKVTRWLLVGLLVVSVLRK